MTDLSPAAQAILEAYDNSPWEYDTGEFTACAAVIRAAADQVVPEVRTPWNSTLTPMISAGEVRARILAIAAELEDND